MNNTSNLLPQIPKVEKEEILFNEFVCLRKDHLVYPGNYHYNYYTLSTTPTSVAIVALDHQQRMLVVQEYRHPPRQILLGCPGGLLLPEEDPLSGARRELLEETGCKADSYKIIGETYPFPGLSDQKCYIVLAQNAEITANPQLDRTEILQSSFLPIDTIYHSIKQGTVRPDGILCASLFFFLASS